MVDSARLAVALSILRTADWTPIETIRKALGGTTFQAMRDLEYLRRRLRAPIEELFGTNSVRLGRPRPHWRYVLPGIVMPAARSRALLEVPEAVRDTEIVSRQPTCAANEEAFIRVIELELLSVELGTCDASRDRLRVAMACLGGEPIRERVPSGRARVVVPIDIVRVDDEWSTTCMDVLRGELLILSVSAFRNFARARAGAGAWVADIDWSMIRHRAAHKSGAKSASPSGPTAGSGADFDSERESCITQSSAGPSQDHDRRFDC